MSFAGLASSLSIWLLSGGTLVLHHPFDEEVLEQQINELKCDTLIAPADLQAHVRAMSEAAASLRTATNGFIIYLDDPELEYNDATARPHVSAMARAWYAFKKAHGEANQVIKQQKEK